MGLLIDTLKPGAQLIRRVPEYESLKMVPKIVADAALLALVRRKSTIGAALVKKLLKVLLFMSTNTSGLLGEIGPLSTKAEYDDRYPSENDESCMEKLKS